MGRDVILKYGGQEIRLVKPHDADVLELGDLGPAMPVGQFRTQLKQALTASPLDLSSPAIIVADKSRRCQYPRYLPVLLQELEEAGAEIDSIRIYIAYGTHAPQTQEESLATYGECFDQYTFVHHDCTETNAFVELGTTSRGTPIRVRRDVLEASCRITFGALSHHYFAGFGGGRKLFFPGVAEKQAIYHNHGLFLDRKTGWLSTGCNPGQLQGNPLAEDLQEIAEYVSADLAVHGILNSHLEMIDAVFGRNWDDFLRACEIHDQNMGYDVDGPYDYAVASCGGYPKDINLIQAHKSLHHAAMLVRDGGTLILLTECRDQVGSQTFLPWFDYPSKKEAFAALAADYQGNGGTALSLMTKAERLKIKLVTALPDEVCSKIGVEKVALEQLQETIDGLPGKGAFIPSSGIIIPKIKKNE